MISPWDFNIRQCQRGEKIKYHFLNQFGVYDFTSGIVHHCVEGYFKLRKNGRLINGPGVLIWGICAENRVDLITNRQDC